MQNRAKGEILIHRPVPIDEALDDPRPGVNVLVVLQLVQLGNHLAEVQGTGGQLDEFPVDDGDGGLGS